MPVAFILDGRHAVPDWVSADVILLSRVACEALGLFCPHDYAWRCGDYGLYLARKRFPDAPHFWMVEYDVRIGGDAAEFFERFKSVDADLLTSYLRPAEPDWRWYEFASGRGITTYRCFYPLQRISARALDLLAMKRIAHSQRRQRRAAWSNDESFTATTLMAAGLTCHDLNDFGAVYDEATFSFFQPIRGETLVHGGPPKAYHPVLFGEDYERKIATLKAKPGLPSFSGRVEQRVRRAFNRFLPW